MVATIIIGAAIAAAFVFALTSIIRKRMRGDCGCGMGADCPNCRAYCGKGTQTTGNKLDRHSGR